LIYGEIGCGQNRIASGILWLQKISGSRISINAAELSEEYLGQKNLELSMGRVPQAAPPTLVIENLDKSGVAGQSLLLRFLEDTEEKSAQIRYLATANADLLQNVYAGDFLEALYYKLATLTLKLPPLRERREDIPVIADWFVRSYAEALGLSEPVLSTEAQSRLCNYMWFGNLSELETVMARTLAWHRKSHIEAADLVFDFSVDTHVKDLGDFAEYMPAGKQAGFDLAEPMLQVGSAVPTANISANGHEKSVDLNVVIHELAHELKNPMVTIKTFSENLEQLLNDPGLRDKFVGLTRDAIDRMDGFLEELLRFSRYAEPKLQNLSLAQALKRAVDGQDGRVRERVKTNALSAKLVVRVDEDQLTFALKSLIRGLSREIPVDAPISVELSPSGELTFNGGGAGGTQQKLHATLDQASNGSVPWSLDLMMAEALIRRNGGSSRIVREQDQLQVRVSFPSPERGLDGR
jgi:Sigma-54 interaction domain/His Kinase A (phospho-acceptor) domain